ncbi:MAG TPA: MoaD/ThiS family protein [Flavobacteriia bacterium]|nr:MoaD/ThiS family protein [Flavobacteriia bacterium]
MEIKILFFGITRDLTHEQEVTLTFSENELLIEKVKNYLQKKYPNLKDLDTYALAINEEYANNQDLVKDKDVIAVIPPVSGG